MTGETIKSFLVGLGFGVDDASLSKFNKAIASATIRVTALATAVETSAAGIVYGISEISKGFEDLGYELKILAPAINKTLLLRNEMYKAYSATGVNLVKVVQSAAKLNLSLEKTKIVIQAIYRSTASRFFELLTKQSDLFRQKIYANLPRIQALLERSVKFIFKMLEAVTDLGIRLWSILGRVYDFFVLLDQATGGWSTKIVAVIAAWKALNLSFLATPLGMILAGLAAILVLFDDFETWKEGGETLFDWSSFVPVINAVGEAIKAVRENIENSIGVLRTLVDLFNDLINADWAGFVADWNTLGGKLYDRFFSIVNLVSRLVGLLSEVGTWISKVTGANAALNNTVNFLSGTNVPLARSEFANGAQTNQNVNMQTNVNIHGVADAQSAGKHAGNEVAKQNMVGTRLLKSATAPAGEN